MKSKYTTIKVFKSDHEAMKKKKKEDKQGMAEQVHSLISNSKQYK